MNLRDELQTIYETRGELTPRVVLEEATDPAHALHPRFEWDDTAAAHAWRLEQAHRLIQRVKIVYRPATAKAPAERIRAFHSVPDGSGYRPVEEVAADEFLSELLLREMERSWYALQRKFGQFEAFAALVRKTLDESAA